MKYEVEEEGIKYKVEYLGENYSNDYMTYKVIILGSFGVGKTTIIKKLTSEEIDNEYLPTISADIKNIQIKVNDKIIQIQFWDTCGNEQFIEKTPNLFKNISATILVFAIDDKNSFNAIEKWYNVLKNYSFDNIIFLIGNKIDANKEREVKKEEGEEIKNKYSNIKMFFETSCILDNNIDLLFGNISISLFKKNEIFEKKVDNALTKTFTITLQDNLSKNKEQKIKKKKCCS